MLARGGREPSTALTAAEAREGAGPGRARPDWRPVGSWARWIWLPPSVPLLVATSPRNLAGEQQRRHWFDGVGSQSAAAATEEQGEVAQVVANSLSAAVDIGNRRSSLSPMAIVARDCRVDGRLGRFPMCLEEGLARMLSEALRLIRVFHDLKQADLALRLGLSKSYVSEIEGGTKTPTIEIIEKYAREFKVPASSILFFSEQLDPGTRRRSARDRARGVIASKILDLLKLVENKTDYEKNEEIL